jgi:hypothetical protein
MVRQPALGMRFSLITVLVGIVLTSPCWADRIQLRGGGEVKGVVVPGASKPDQVMVQTEAAAKPVAFAKSRVLKVVRESGPLDEYFARRDRIEAKAEAQYEFGLWCEQNKLSGLAQVHYQRAVELDRSYAPAHKKLGHVLHNDAWVTYDELREAQGMVKHKGKWISRQKQDQLASRATETADQTSWARRIRILHRNLTAGNNAERADAEKQLAEIRDPAAIPGLVKILGNDVEATRARLAHLLGAIVGPEAQAALIGQVLAEPDPGVRKVALDELARRKEPDTAARLVRSLRSSDPDVIGRAAWGLAQLHVTAAVPKLVPALFQFERKSFVEPPADGVGAFTASFGGPVGGGAAVSSGPGAGFVTSHAVPILTGPVVGPGVVAFGGTSVPFYSGATLGTGGVVPGGDLSGPATKNVPVVRTITIAHPNHDVLAALEKLTGRNFGFNLDAWQHWLATEFSVEGKPTRRAPQPGTR